MSVPLIVPDWPAPSNVGAACSTREGGVSNPPYDSLNLGDHVGDDAAHVAINRQRFVDALHAQPVFMRQVHGISVADLSGPFTEADACVTREPGIACTIMVADCMPLLFTDQEGTQVGAAHAGWRGLAGGVIEATLARFDEPEGVIAWLGPCIGPKHFEVGAEVKAAFERVDARAARHFRPHAEGKFLADLPALARMRLQSAGVASVHGNDGADGWCTVANASRFFSHRRDRVSGRFAAAVWRRA
ncbi:peptidoglycan editing factor PgeF [Ramlibacter sp.]|uniref:peptidoglycan editing factor PgeF n=1 Tax=Ramlibacter sp. TaxID=1917967 RepID=UPI003D0A5820